MLRLPRRSYHKFKNDRVNTVHNGTKRPQNGGSTQVSEDLSVVFEPVVTCIRKDETKEREGTAEEDSTRQSRDRSGSQDWDLSVCCCGVIVQRTESSNKSATAWRRTRIPSTEVKTCKQSTVKQQKENYFNNGGSTNSLSQTHENMGKATRSSEKTSIPWRRQGYSTTSHDAYEISDPHTATCRSSQTCASRSGNVHVPDFQEAGEHCRPS